METHANPIVVRLIQLGNLCGEDPSAALAARIHALPLWRDLGGWIAVRPDGEFLFVDNDTGRVSAVVPESMRERAIDAAGERWPDVAAFLRNR